MCLLTVSSKSWKHLKMFLSNKVLDKTINHRQFSSVRFKVNHDHLAVAFIS